MEFTSRDKERNDTNLCLQKNYAYLHWSQGAGKTVSGTAQGMYRLAHEQTDYVVVVSSAISIETTWAPFFSTYRIPHRVIKKRADLRRVFPGDFILITLGRVKNYKRQIQKIVKLASRRLMLIYDEAQNSSALEENEDVGKLTKATLACFCSLKYKLLKERMLRFLKGQDISFEDLFAEMGFELEHHQGAVFKGHDDEGHPQLYWGRQQIAA